MKRSANHTIHFFMLAKDRHCSKNNLCDALPYARERWNQHLKTLIMVLQRLLRVFPFLPLNMPG